MRRISLLACAFSASIICSLFVVSGSTQAAALYATGFEPPSFVVGSINGQNGWFVLSESAQQADPVIETTLVKSGLQAVSINGFVAGQTGPVYAPNFVDPVLALSADIYVGSSSSTESEWQFGTTGAGGFGFAGGIDIEGTQLVAISGDHPVIGSITRDAWHDVSLLLNYVTQTFSVSIDGTVISSGLPFCGNNSVTMCNGAPVTTMGWDLFDTFGNGSDIGAMDNFAIASVPEPSSWAMMLMGFVGLGFAGYRASRKAALVAA
jgi:hypothetical protein